MNKQSTTETAKVPSNERVLLVLSVIAGHGTPISARDISVKTKLPLSSLYRQLKILKKWGLVQENSHSGLYQPGPMGLQLAWGFDQHSRLMHIAHAEMVELAEKTGESIGLLAHVNGQIICLDMLESQQPLRCSFAKGKVNSAVLGASAKALLAHLPETTLKPILDNYPTDEVTLPKQLEQCRQDGYAVSESEIDQDVWGVSAPVFSAENKLECTLSLMAPASRALAHAAEYIALTQAAAERITQQLAVK